MSGIEEVPGKYEKANYISSTYMLLGVIGIGWFVISIWMYLTDVVHLQSATAVPQITENGLFISMIAAMLIFIVSIIWFKISTRNEY